MKENSIFIITPPDMMLSDNGPTITVISTDDAFREKIEEIHGNLFKTVPVNIYHPNGAVTTQKLAWTLSVMRLSDTIFVDLATSNDISIIASILSEREVIYINTNNKRKDIAQLFNNVPDGYQVFDTLDEYLEVMLLKLGLK
jgi:hypothetical protein